MTVKKELLPKNTRGTALIAVVQNCERKGEPALLHSTGLTLEHQSREQLPHPTACLFQCLRRQVTRPLGPQTHLLVWPDHLHLPKLSSHW